MLAQDLFAILGTIAAFGIAILHQVRAARVELRAEIDKKVEGVRTDLGEKIESLRTEFGEKIEAVRTEFGEKIEAVRKENEDIREQIGALTHRMRLLENAMIEIKATLETYLRVRVAPPLGRPGQPRTGTDG